MTCFISGHRVANVSCIKVAGSAYKVDIPGRRIYLYPGLDYGYVNGFFAKLCQVISVFLYGFPCIEALNFLLDTDEIVFDPSTVTRLSRQPLRSDPYEDLHVYVSPSTISPEAGEGLFAKENIEKGQLVCLFNGIRRTKEGRAAKAISCYNEDWSDYRLFLGKLNFSWGRRYSTDQKMHFSDHSTDLDIPTEFVSIDKYKATLGHKACHTFGQAKNSRFDNLWHPRFGLIMSIVALRPIKQHEEILVNYNYDLKLAPEWYRSLWFQYKKDEET